MAIESCRCCGSGELVQSPVLWEQLIHEWGLSSEEIVYINRQQGLYCGQCRSNLRSMALAEAVMRFSGYGGLFKDFVASDQVRDSKILEINEAGSLTQFFVSIPGHTLAMYPDVDMMQLPFSNQTFDLVIHSDTLEHIADPVKALSECLRVLKPNGCCAFTVPMIVDRLSRFRTGMSPSYHGNAATHQDDFLVHTEYGADAWKHVIQAGFQECRLFALEYPAAQAFVAIE